jgi:hypothetical protein
MDTPRVLLEHYLKQLRLPTMVREFLDSRMARHASGSDAGIAVRVTNRTYLRFS